MSAKQLKLIFKREMFTHTHIYIWIKLVNTTKNHMQTFCGESLWLRCWKKMLR